MAYLAIENRKKIFLHITRKTVRGKNCQFSAKFRIKTFEASTTCPHFCGSTFYL